MSHGMSLRDYFAAHALQGMIAEPSLKATPEEFAQKAYQIADSMMEARGLWLLKTSLYM